MPANEFWEKANEDTNQPYAENTIVTRHITKDKAKQCTVDHIWFKQIDQFTYRVGDFN